MQTHFLQTQFVGSRIWKSSLVALNFLVCFSLCGPAAFSQTRFLHFNTPGQYTSNFVPWNDGGGVDSGNYAFAESESEGVAGSGGVSVFQSSDTTATYDAASWDFATDGATITVSLLVKANGQTSGNKVQLGITDASNNGLNNNSGVAFESFRTIPSSSTLWSLREQYRTADLSPVETTLGNVNVIPGHWYKFVFSATNTSSFNSSFDADFAILDYGVDGQTPGANILSFSALQSHAGQDIAASPAVWPALRAWQNAGIDAWDNFLTFTANSLPVLTLSLTNVTVP